MKLTWVILLCAAVCLHAEESGERQEKIQEGKNEKRALLEGNEGVKKRTPDGDSQSPLPGIEYADAKESTAEKASVQQIYATPVPQVAKISDVLTGQAQVPFPAAIAHHLYSPVSIYQPRLGSPTIYEVSAPVPSQLAYSEHKVYQNPRQPIQKPASQNGKPILDRFGLNPYQQPQQSQTPVFLQPQPVLYTQQSQPPQFVPPPHLFQYNQFPQPQIYNQPQAYTQNPQPLYTITPTPFYPQNAIQPRQQYQEPSYLQVFKSIQPGVTYARQQNTPNVDYSNQPNNYQVNNPRDFKTPERIQQTPSFPQQNYNNKQQGAISYASFSQSSPNYANSQNPSQYVPHAKQAPASINTLITPKSPSQQELYIRPGHYVDNLQYQQNPPQFAPQQPRQQQFYQNPQPQPVQGILVQNSGYTVPQPVQLSPEFAPVQYYGKFAGSIFGNYQQ